ncbi:MAG TPA: hypothetical protein DIS78_06975 [Lachnospiraceae bacterium]|nr:hypothetical protein [Lachnospiraceae bacterium]
MNISVQLCGLINTVVLLIFYLSAIRLRSYKRRIFLLILFATIANISLDISSIIAIYFKDFLPIVFVNLVCKLYVCMLVTETFIAIIYMLADMLTKDRHKMLSAILAVINIVECFLVMRYPIHIYAEGKAVYTYGTSINMIYAFAAVNISIIWICSFAFEDRIKKRRVYSVRLWMLIWLVGMGVQAINHELLVVGFASSLGIMVVYFMIENPEGFIDKQFSCLNSLALDEYVEESICNSEKFHISEIVLDDVEDLKADTEETRDRIANIIGFMQNYKEIDVFKGLDKNLILVSSSLSSINIAMESFVNIFGKDSGGAGEAYIIFMENAHRYKSLQEIFNIVAYLKACRQDGEDVILKVDDKMVLDYRRRDHIREEINNALKEDRVEVFLQPIYNTAKKMFTSAEALVRIRNTDGTLLPPGLFVSVAEETGQITELGKRVLEKTCGFLGTGEATALGIEYIEVNLSVVQAEKPNLFNEIIDTVGKYRIKPSQINLEITESALIRNKDVVINNMNQLKKVGFTFALDDFGKGESNLMYLVEMPFDILKLDMDMTKAFHVNDKAKSAVKTVRYMADDMKLKIVAEGIESIEEFNDIMVYNMDYIQGYYFSKALPMHEFIDFIKMRKNG